MMTHQALTGERNYRWSAVDRARLTVNCRAVSAANGYWGLDVDALGLELAFASPAFLSALFV
jgi:hypothetical protein